MWDAGWWGAEGSWSCFFEILVGRLPDVRESIEDSRGYIIHRGARNLYTANWKTTEHGCIVYSAGTLDIHIKNSYHNAYQE